MMHYNALAVFLGFVLIQGCGRNTPLPTIKVDGLAGKWRTMKPAWDNGPAPANQPPDEIHITKVFFSNDSNYFYVFIQCSPTILERDKRVRLSGSFANIFFDPENNPGTGSPGYEMRSETSPMYRGYKVRVNIPLGITDFMGASGGATFVGYDVYRFTGEHLDDNDGLNGKIPDSSQDTLTQSSLIANGKDGVEMAIPLKVLGLKPGTTARIMIDPTILRPEVGFITYRCK